MSIGPKFTMSSAPHDTDVRDAGARDRAEAVFGAAGIPRRRGDPATSVVVTSITPATSPESTSFSIDCPPVPVAWKVRQSYRSSSCFTTCCTQGVVTPNIVSPTAGRVSRRAPRRPGAIECAIMPASACAAFESTCSEIRLMPCTSTTEYIMQMSEGPT